MIVIMDGEEYEDGVDLLPEELYRKMKEENKSPTTSQPSVGTFYELYKKLEKEYDRVVSVHLSSELSGTVSAKQSRQHKLSRYLWMFLTPYLYRIQ